MTGVRPFVEHAAAVLGDTLIAGGLFISAVMVVIVIAEALLRRRARRMREARFRAAVAKPFAPSDPWKARR